jgi:NAD(P)-dependent dehydrogenase (short-subunit alcohol dehydrogenase family)
MPTIQNGRSLEGMVALVTGAGQGLGRGIAFALVDRGARVAVTGRTLEKCEVVAAEITDRGGEAIAVRCDVSRREEVEECVGVVAAKWDRIDTLVNSAQTITYASVRRITDDEADLQWQSGPLGTLRTMQTCFPHLREQKGTVINVASGAGITASPGMGVYAMTKEAIRTLTRVAAVEWGRYGIRVNVICPFAETPGLQEWQSDMPGAFEEQVINQIPLQRVGDPTDDIGAAVAFLAGPDSSYITGTTLMLDGGYTYLR